MSASLTTLITQMQAMLLDDGTIFSTATCTAAAGQALGQFNRSAPVTAATLVDGVEGQTEYALNGPDFANLLNIYGVWRQGVSDRDEPLPFDACFEDNAPFIRLREAVSEGVVLIVRYAIPHTVNGLEDANESTLTDDQDRVLVIGACAAAIGIRLTSRVETINLAADVAEHYRAARGYFTEAFQNGLRTYSRRAHGTGQADTGAWNDGWHIWEQ